MFGRQINEFSASKLNSKGLIWYDKSEHVDYVPMEMTLGAASTEELILSNLILSVSTWIRPSEPGSNAV